MCGIAGFTGSRRPELLRRMTGAIHYRGPDSDGFFETESVSLGHRRLSIIDLSTGDQPMFSHDKKLVVIFNGEIYNFQELRSQVASYPFRTSSDTEVILALYEKFGPDCVKLLNGMFAFALWDENRQALLLARDRMGKKPLYVTERDGRLYFASEPKALLASIGSPSINELAASLYFEFQFVPGRQSIYEGIERILPGEYLVWHDGKATRQSYWQLRFSDTAAPSLERLDSLLADAVKIRLIADVPLGIFLSGGIDSSTVTYYAVKASAAPIKTFSIGFEDASFDESRYFNEVARRLGTDHHHHMFTERELLDVMPVIFERLDEPLADASILPTYLLSRFTRQEVTVALGGDGADELFAGYPTFIAHRLANMYRYLPNALQRLAEQGVSALPVSHANISFDFKLKQFIKGAALTGRDRDRNWMAAFTPQELPLLLGGERFAKLVREREEAIDEFFPASGTTSEVIQFWQKGYLVDDILAKVDRAAMYNSLEVRAPFLDYRIVEYLNELPYAAKLHGFTTKYLLKWLMKGKLPDAVVHRAKKGFGIPLSRWLRTEILDIVYETLTEQRLASVGLNAPYVRSLIEEHRAGARDHRMKLWTLIVYVQWFNHWIAH